MVDESGDREQEEHGGGDVAQECSELGPLAEDAEAIGGQQQTAKGLTAEHGVTQNRSTVSRSAWIASVRLPGVGGLLQLGTQLALRCAERGVGGARVPGFLGPGGTCSPMYSLA